MRVHILAHLFFVKHYCPLQLILKTMKDLHNPMHFEIFENLDA